MSSPETDRSSSRRILSALADGDCTDGETARAFQAWRDDDDARTTWHAYHLIGDVLRSDDLATAPAGDQAFLLALRARLADEPVVLAPQAVEEASATEPVAARGAVRSRGRWQAPLAMAAGFLAVIGGYNVMRPASHGAAAPIAFATNPSTGAAPNPATSAPTGDASVVAASARTPTQADAAQLAPYLAAHRQSTMNSAFQMPGGDIRNVSMVQTAP